MSICQQRLRAKRAFLQRSRLDGGGSFEGLKYIPKLNSPYLKYLHLMLGYLSALTHRYLSNEESLAFLLLLLLLAAAMYFFSQALMPFLISLVVVFLLLDPVRLCARYLKLSYKLSALLIYLLFLGAVVALFIYVLPIIIQQLRIFAVQIPSMIEFFNAWLNEQFLRYPEFFAEQEPVELVQTITDRVGSVGQDLAASVLTSFNTALTYLIYFVLVPVIVFFVLMDKEKLGAFFSQLLPSKRDFMRQIWAQMQQQASNYVRGKIIEIAIIGALSFVTFLVLGLQFALLLGLAVGLSVIIPYLGAALVTVPVVLVALFQFGTGSEFWWVVGCYFAIQIFDGNILVPWLFSEAVNLHPLTIILAVLVFGSLWGVLGVFFAIPLATFVKVIAVNWPVADLPSKAAS